MLRPHPFVLGRLARLSRAFGVDGKKYEAIVLGMWVRVEQIQSGERMGEDPGLMIDFLGEKLRQLSRGSMGPWTSRKFANHNGWCRVTKRIPIPPGTLDAIMTVGLLGATGVLDIDGFSIVELADEIEALPAARWMKTHAPTARVAARCSNVPSVHLAIKSGAGIAPLPAVYAAADEELVCVLGPLPELSYPMFLLAHRDLRKIPRVNAVFEFCLAELKPVLKRGEMKK